MDPLALLGRKDKWSLAGGRGSLYAPAFPKHLLAPGFWDPCFLGEIKIPRMFTAFVLNDRDRPIRFDSYHKGWRPDRLTIMHYSGDVVIRERRCVTEAGAFVSELELVTAVGPLHVVMVSILPENRTLIGSPAQYIEELRVGDESIDVPWLTAHPKREALPRIEMEEPQVQVLSLGAGHARQSVGVRRSCEFECAPQWEATFLPQTFRDGRLDGVVSVLDPPGKLSNLVHIAQHYVLEDRRPLVLACGIGDSIDEAVASRQDAIRDEPLRRSESEWRAFFGQVPRFESSDPYLNAAYWYRWHEIRAAKVDGPKRSYLAPRCHTDPGLWLSKLTVLESQSAREAAWMRTPDLAEGIFAKCEWPSSDSTTAELDRMRLGAIDWTVALERLRHRHGVEIPSERFDGMRGYLGQDQHRRNAGRATLRVKLALWYNDPDANELARELILRMFDNDALILRSLSSDDRPDSSSLLSGLELLAIPGVIPDDVASLAVRRWLLADEGFKRERGWMSAKRDSAIRTMLHLDRTDMESNQTVSTRALDILDSFAQRDPSLKPVAANLLMRSIRDRFLDGDPYRPHGYANFDPVTGDPALHTGLDMAVAGCLVDHILTSVVGVRGETVDPLPVDVDWVQCEGIPCPGRTMSVHWRNGLPPTVEFNDSVH